MKKKIEKLAIRGGEPVRKKPWPIWPRADENTEKLLKDVLYSGRWTISGCYTGKKPYERQFAEAFAKFNNAPYCVPTANGSSAIKIALQALNVGYGKEVLVPGLTWVACASSVLGVGAVPILVDIESDTLCMSFKAAKKAITKNTAAIMLVHLYSRIANMEEFLSHSFETGIPIIEDCSHVHGSVWKGQRVGTFGKIGVFSMQQSKVLTCGEGGAVITKDKKLYDKMQEFRADGRRYKTNCIPIGEMELEEIGSVQGGNYCMSEFHAAILLDRLQHLDEENKIRAKNANYLNSLLLDIGGITPLAPSNGTDLPTYYQYCVRLNLPALGNSSIDLIAQALTSELGIMVKPVYNPLSHNILYNPLSSFSMPLDYKNLKLNPQSFDLPNSEAARKECLTFPHQVLLSSKEDLNDIAEAFKKVKKNNKAFQKEKSVELIKNTNKSDSLFNVVEIEVNSRCNRKCEYCPVSVLPPPEVPQFMCNDVFKKILDELDRVKFSGKISYHFKGEPLLRHDLEILVEQIKERLPYAYQLLFTNGSLLTNERYTSLLNAGIDHFKVTKHDFIPILGRPHQTVLYPSDLQISGCGGIIFKLDEPLALPCYAPCESLIITITGDVVLCCEDAQRSQVMGNIMSNSLEEIWFSDKFSRIRKLLKDGKRSEATPICKHCNSLDCTEPGYA